MRTIVLTVVAFLIAVAGWWYVSPIWTLHEMRDAAQQHEAARLSAYVDYPALREDLKSDLGRFMLSEADKHSAADGGKFGAAIAMAFVGPVVDAAVTPEGVRAMFAAQDRTRSGATPPLMPVKAGDQPIIERAGFDSFQVHGKDASKGALVFHRVGLGWKLVGVDLPRPIRE